VELTAHLRDLRRQGRLAEAQALLAQALAERPDGRLQLLAWQHQDFWWQPLRSPRVTLRRRGPDDAVLVRRCWSDGDFMRRFNRMAAPLPPGDDALCALLAREHWALPEEARALHWRIDAGGAGCGFVSVVELSLQHRRGEFLIGVLPGTGPWVAPTAAHLLLDWLARHAQLERLSASFYTENAAAQVLAEKLGFQHEGVQRGHLRLPDGSRADLVLAGLLLNEDFFARSARLRKRLLDGAHGD
jgi:[ribosomal protein S5]-alanine N-acetyltransferase